MEYARIMIYSQWYYSKYQSPNIIIVPTEELPQKKAKLDVDHLPQNIENRNQDTFRNLITIPLTNTPEAQCSNSNISKSDCQSQNVKPNCALNSVQNIEQVYANRLYTQIESVSFEGTTENINGIPETKSTSITEENPIIELPNINCSESRTDEKLTPIVQEMKCNDDTEDLKPFKNVSEINNYTSDENSYQVENKSTSVYLESIPELYKNNTADKSSQTANAFTIPGLDKSHDANSGDLNPFINGKLAIKLESNECSSKKNKSVNLESVKQIYKNKAEEKRKQAAKTYTSHERKQYPHKHHSEPKSKHRRGSNYADKLSKHSYSTRYRSEFKTNRLESNGTHKTGYKSRLLSSSKKSSSYTKKYNHKTNSKYTSMRQTDHNLISSIGSVVLQFPNSKSSPPTSPMIGIHKAMDLRNKLSRKRNKRGTPREKDEHCNDKHRTKKKANSNISVNNANNTELKTNGGKQVVKEINFVINIILEQEEHSKNDCKDSTNNYVDLSFLDDFNIDDIVESLNDNEKTQCDDIINNSCHIATIDLTTINEEKSSYKTEISKLSEFSKAENIIKQAERLLPDYRLESEPVKAPSDGFIINTTNKTDEKTIKKEKMVN